MKFLCVLIMLISSVIYASPFDSTPLMFSSVSEFKSSFDYRVIYSEEKLSYLNLETVSRENLKSVHILNPNIDSYNKSFLNNDYYNHIQYHYNITYGPILFQAYNDFAVLFNNPAKIMSVVKLNFFEDVVYAYVVLQKDFRLNKYYTYIVYNYRDEDSNKDKVWIYHLDNTYDFYFRFYFLNVERVSDLKDVHFNNLSVYAHYFNSDVHYIFNGKLYSGQDLIPNKSEIGFFNLTWRVGISMLSMMYPDRSFDLSPLEYLPKSICSVPIAIDFSKIKDTEENEVIEKEKTICPYQEEFFVVNRRYNRLRRRYIVSNVFIHFWTGVFITSVISSGVSLVGYGIVRFGLENFDVSRILGIIFLSSGCVAISALPIRFFVSVITSPIAVNFYEARDRRRELLNKINFHIKY